MFSRKNAVKSVAAIAGGLALALSSVVPAMADPVEVMEEDLTETSLRLITNYHLDGSTDDDYKRRVVITNSCGGGSGLFLITLPRGLVDCNVSIQWYKDVKVKGSKGKDAPTTEEEYGFWSGVVPALEGDDNGGGGDDGGGDDNGGGGGGGDGAPETNPDDVIPSGPAVRIGAMDSLIYFTPDSPRLSPQAIKKIVKMAETLPEGATGILVTVVGFIHPTSETDPKLKAYRQSLPEKRAKAVVRQLAKLGMTAKFQIVGVKTPLSADPKSRKATITISYTY